MNRSPHLKRFIWMGVLVTAAGGLAWSLRPQPVLVRTSVVERGPLVATVSGEGRTSVKELYTVPAPVDGELDRVTVHVGDEVAAGAVVAEIRPAASRPLDARARSEATAAAAAAAAGVARADAAEREARMALEHADSLYATARLLAERGAGPRADSEHRGHEAEIRRRAVEEAGAAAQAARAELARARAVLAPATTKPGQVTPVRAPAAGRILRVLRESAGPVAAGAPLLDIGDTSRLEVRAELLSSDAAQIHPGAAATITGWGAPEPLRARVRRVDPAAFTKISALGIEEQRVHVVLDLDGAPPTGLGHGYRVDAAVVVWEGRDVLQVPSTALFRAGDRWAVFAIQDGHARRALVEVGASDGTSTVVKSGVGAGQSVVVQPSDAIDDGTRVASL